MKKNEIRARLEIISPMFEEKNYTPTSFARRYNMNRIMITRIINEDPVPQTHLAAFCFYLGLPNLNSGTHTDDLDKIYNPQ